MSGTESLSWWHIIIAFAVIMLGMWLAKISKSKTIAAATCFIMICISGLRHGYIDTRAYRHGFENLNISEVFSKDFIFYSDSKDKGFYLLSATIKIFTDNSQVFLFIFALFTVGFLFWGIVKRVPEIDFGIFLFIASGAFIDTMNGLRQAFVSAVLFYFLPRFLEKRETAKYILLVLLMSTMHASALVFILIYFIASKDAWSKYTAVIIAIASFMYIFYNYGIGEFIAEFLDDTSYGKDYGEMLLTGNTSVNIIRVFIATVPLVLTFFTGKYKEKGNRKYNIYFNMTLINFMMWLFSSKVLYFYRMALYFAPYSIVFLCNEIDSIPDKQEKRIVKTAAFIFYLIYFVYSLYVMKNEFFIGYLKY